jgi:hypothetical protein
MRTESRKSVENQLAAWIERIRARRVVTDEDLGELSRLVAALNDGTELKISGSLGDN